jgi:subtilisin family serine protease
MGSSQSEREVSPARAGAWRRTSLVLLAVSFARALPLVGQSVPDSYRVAGRDVPLDLYLDSLAVVTVEELTGQQVASLVEPALGVAVSVRPLAARAWVIGLEALTRAELVHQAASLRELETLRSAGLVVRAPGATDPAVVTDEILVRYHPWVERTEIDALNAQLGAEIVGGPALAPNLFLQRARPDAPRDALELARLFLEQDEVLYAHPDFFLSDRPSAFFPDDPLFTDQWHLYNPGVSVPPGTPRPDIHAPEAWDITRGASKVTIAILEQGGFDALHPDLVNRLWENPWMTGTKTGPQPFDKANDVHGWNFDGCPTSGIGDPAIDPCGTPDLTVPASKPIFHGTQVAGVAAAQGNNALGVSGVCPDCSLMLVRIGYTTAFVRAAAVVYANAMGADVINMSFHTQYTDNTFIDAISQAAMQGRANRGITIVAAPFDYTFDQNICGASPPLLAGQPDVISVIMSDDHDTRQPGAMGPCLDLMSPGVGIWTTTERGTGPSGTDYRAVKGNSFAAPVVSGVAGLLLSVDYDLTRAEIRAILEETADKVDGGGYGSDGHSNTHGFGRVNAFRALERVQLDKRIAVDPDLPPTPAEPPSGPEVGVRLGLTVLGGGRSDRILGLPGQGPLAAPVVYATVFPGALLVDGQLGYSQRWGATPDTRALHAAIMIAYTLPLGGGTLYAGPSIAVQSVDLGGGASTEWGGGAATGVRWTASSYLALRVETSYRWWGGPGVNEWGLGVGMGVRLP